MAQKPFSPTDKDRSLVQAMAAVGVPQKDIAKVIGCDEKTLRKYFPEELELGAIKANATVGRFLYQQAQTNLTAAIFWAKCRMGWKEKQEIEHTGKNGAPLIPEFHVNILKIGTGSDSK